MDKYFPFPEKMLPWFRENKRDLPWRKNKTAYSVWVSEIMLQQTRVEAVKEYFTRFMTALPTVEALASCDEEKLLKLWEGLGYYSRARNLKKCAEKIVSEYNGVFPKEREKLIKLPGIGEYTASSLSSIAYNEKNPAIDGNVLRVFARVEADHSPIDDGARRREIYGKLKANYPEEAGEYTESLMELGALVCLPDNPRCALCPLNNNCLALEKGEQKELPVIPKKPEKKRVKLNVFLIQTEGGYALQKRERSGVLAGLWEFLNVENDGTMPEIQLKNLGVGGVSYIKKVKSHTHVFTHLIWEMTAYFIKAESVKGSVFPLDKIKSEISLPTAFRWGVEEIEKYDHA